MRTRACVFMFSVKHLVLDLWKMGCCINVLYYYYYYQSIIFILLRNGFPNPWKPLVIVSEGMCLIMHELHFSKLQTRVWIRGYSFLEYCNDDNNKKQPHLITITQTNSKESTNWSHAKNITTKIAKTFQS